MGTIRQHRRYRIMVSDFSAQSAGSREERRMVQTMCFYLAVIVLSIGTVASYFIPLP